MPPSLIERPSVGNEIKRAPKIGRNKNEYENENENGKCITVANIFSAPAHMIGEEEVENREE
jgi:hypothetical protein